MWRERQKIICSKDNMEVSGHGKIEGPKQIWSDVITYTKRDEGERSRERRSTRPENLEKETLMC